MYRHKLGLLGLLVLALFLLSSCGSGPHLEPDPDNQQETVQEPPPKVEPPTTETDQAPDNAGDTANQSPNDDANLSQPDNPDAESTPPAPEKSVDALWVAVGDIMMHMPQLPGAYNEKTKKYNFEHFFKPMKPILEQGDWTLANLETPIAGKSLGYSGYPRFNAPTELGDALKYAGFTTVTTANNHALDRGAKGIALTLQKLDELGFETKGTARSRAEADRIVIAERKGIAMGLLAYTYGTNGIPLPKDQPYAVSLIDEAKIISDIAKLRKAGADFITVVLHFGIEYQTQPNDAQKNLARKLIAAGADIIAGSHPHVVQPYEIVEAAEPDGSVRKGLIIYSMGNFISNQRGDSKDYGVVFRVNIHKDGPTGRTSIQNVEALPTWVHRVTSKGVTNYNVVPLQQVIASKSLKDLSGADYSTLKQMYNQLMKRLKSMSGKPFQVTDGLNQ
ncbi:CapA family protein [Paenibacillus sp. CF384]|uniref:CapA family protein n=1 Tax=Paenibacillus sp. CF384 TaxID=1884382 RepID=UPI00089BF94E|nr:CapA family protein [Paenibacillus sp. CF384]SDW60566.1 poly-gamma-glutamate synthesis protein (capsule biosynthesis protein) [Paenibacillus sp. CF384]